MDANKNKKGNFQFEKKKEKEILSWARLELVSAFSGVQSSSHFASQVLYNY